MLHGPSERTCNYSSTPTFRSTQHDNQMFRVSAGMSARWHRMRRLWLIAAVSHLTASVKALRFRSKDKKATRRARRQLIWQYCCAGQSELPSPTSWLCTDSRTILSQPISRGSFTCTVNRSHSIASNNGISNEYWIGKDVEVDVVYSEVPSRYLTSVTEEKHKDRDLNHGPP
jgi:hypothetical protein